MTVSVAQPGPLGGASNELGGELRGRFAAYLASYGLRGMEVRLGDKRTHGIPAVVRCEVDDAVDDIEVRFTDGRRVLVQVKQHVSLDLRAGRPFEKVVGQWIAQCSGDYPDQTPLIVVVQSAPRNIRDLATALDSRRDPYAGALTSAQAVALATLTDGLQKHPPVVAQAILARCSILVVDLTEGHGESVAAAGLLDGNVVQAGQGRAAVELLSAAHRERAARRSGLDLDGWIQVLSSGHLDILADVRGCRSAVRTASLAAVNRHRDRLSGQCRTVDLLSLGVALPPIDAVDLTTVTSCPDGDFDMSSPDLDVALRRHGRLLLLGHPGAGKSTMLRWLVGQEADRGWSLPVLVDLRALVETFGDVSRPLLLQHTSEPLDTLVDLAVALTPAEDRALLAQAVRAAARDGSLLLCLDSLDETRRHRNAVVSWIRSLLDRIDSGCDVVLATRTSAYAAAATLEWHEMWIAVPMVAEPVVTNVLEGFAARDNLDSSWVRTRLDWVTSNLERVPTLASTPLLLTAMAVQAAETQSFSDVEGPAQLLDTIIERVASNWERRSGRSGVEFPNTLHNAQVTDALRVAIAHLGWSMISNAGPVRDHVVQAELSTLYARDHGLAPGIARALAESAVHFWDEAGVVVLDHHGNIDSRARHIIEVSAARHLAELSQTERISAVNRLAADPTSFEVLTLLTSLSPEAAADVVATSVARNDRELLYAVASGLCESQLVDPTLTSQLIEALASSATQEEAERAKIIRHLVDLPLPPTVQDRLREIIDDLLPPRAGSVWHALTSDRWNIPDANLTCKAVILAGPPPRPRQPAGLEALLFRDETEYAFAEVVLATARRLTDDDHELAERIRQLAYSQCPRPIARAVYTELGQRGFPNEEPAEHGRRWNGVTALDKRFDKAFEALLEHLAESGSQPVLSVVKRRRLHQLSRLTEGLAIAKGQPGDFPNTAEQHPDDLRNLVEVLVNHGDFDRDELAAEATAFLEEFRRDRFSWLYLMYDAPACDLLRWERSDIDSLIASVAGLYKKTLWLATLATNVLAQVPPSHRSQVLTAAAQAAETNLPPRHRRVASLLSLHIDPDHYIARWRNADDPVLVAATMHRARAIDDRIGLLTEGLNHRDVLVREAAAREMMPHDLTMPAIAETLQNALHLPDQGTCRYCNTTFTERTTNCTTCNLALPDPRPTIRKLLTGTVPGTVFPAPTR